MFSRGRLIQISKAQRGDTWQLSLFSKRDRPLQEHPARLRLVTEKPLNSNYAYEADNNAFSTAVDSCIR